jgi:hypothetical protein
MTDMTYNTKLSKLQINKFQVVKDEFDTFNWKHFQIWKFVLVKVGL